MKRSLVNYVRKTSGAVTVDWIVLVAIVVGLGLAIAIALREEILDPENGLPALLSRIDFEAIWDRVR